MNKSKEILIAAVMSKSFDKVQNAYRDYNIVFDDSYFDYKLLQVALNQQNQHIIRFLLAKVGCRVMNPHKKNLKEETPLHMAMKHNDRYLVRSILKRGASIYDLDHNSYTAIYAGLRYRCFYAVDAGLDYCWTLKNFNPKRKCDIIHFHVACVRNHFSAIQMYLELGFDVNDSLSLEPYVYPLPRGTPLNLCRRENYKPPPSEKINSYKISLNYDGIAPLHYAVLHGSESTVELLLENGANCNKVDSEGQTPLHWACKRTDGVHRRIVEMLIRYGSDTTITDKEGCTPLHYSALHSSVKTVELLLKNKADCNKVDEEGRTPLHWACKRSNETKRVVVLLLNHGSCTTVADEQGYTPVHYMFYYKNNEEKNVFDILISRMSTKVNVTSNQGLSLFHMTCTTSYILQAQDFINSGVNIDASVRIGAYSGYTALHFATLHNRKGIVELLLRQNAQVNLEAELFQVTPLHLACDFNYMKFLDESFTNSFQTFPVDFSSTSNQQNQYDIIKLLISRGAYVNAKDCQTVTPLFHACMVQNYYCPLHYSNKLYSSLLQGKKFAKDINSRVEKIIKIFLGRKANVTSRLATEETILHIISRNIFLNISENLIKLILAKGVDIDVKNNLGLTALHVAVQARNENMVNILLMHKANVNIKCNNSRIPLHIVFENAKFGEDLDIFTALLDNNSDVNMKDGRMIMLHEAVRLENNFVIEQLLNHGADINMESSTGQSSVCTLDLWIAEENDSGLDEHMEDDRDSVSEHEDDRDRYSEDDDDEEDDENFVVTFRIMYTHVQKLLALGLVVSEHVKSHCFNLYSSNKQILLDDYSLNLDNTFKDCTEELERMKLIKLDNYTSLYSFLVKHPHELSKNIMNNVNTIRSMDLDKDFPLYCFLLKLQVKRGLKRFRLMKSAEESLCTVFNEDLPYLCCESIFKKLNNEDIVNLKEAAPLKTLKRKLNYNDSNKSKKLRKKQKRK